MAFGNLMASPIRPPGRLVKTWSYEGPFEANKGETLLIVESVDSRVDICCRAPRSLLRLWARLLSETLSSGRRTT